MSRLALRWSTAGVVFVFVFLGLTATAAERWALVIGINKYQVLGRLATCTADAKAVGDALVRSGGYRPANVVTLTDDASDPSGLPILLNIRRRITQLAAIGESGDTLFVFFSGHGVVVGGEGCLVPLDGDTTADGTIPLAWVRDQLAGSRASLKILALDACHAGSASKGVSGVVPSLSVPSGVLLLLSSGRDQFSYPDENTGRSVFTGFLVDGLSGAAAGPDKLVTVKGLFEFVSKAMKEWSWKSGKTQTPLLVGAPPSSLILASAPNGGVVRSPTVSASGPPKAWPAKTTTHVVGRGESLELIAKKSGVSSTELAALNGIKDPWKLYIGQKLILPGRLDTAAVSPTPSSAPGLDRDWQNTLGMQFKPVPGTRCLFSIWETRVQDYQVFAQAVNREWPKPSFAQEATHPAAKVSWEDAQAFCRWLTEKEKSEGKLPANWVYRLPTDLEWSAAVGLNGEAGSTPQERDEKVANAYPWGTEWPPPRGAGNYNQSLNVDDYEYTSPVGSFNANRHGLYDLGGNVWEWCEDKYQSGQDWRVLRGASWVSFAPGSLLSSNRNHVHPDFRSVNCGFRCVLSEFVP
jgi:LysM repeat protein